MMPTAPIAGQKKAILIHKSFGPTIVHYEHEIFLWLSLSLLSASSIQALYRRSAFAFWGDFIYCFLASLWLSRHLILRYIYTADVSTNRSPTLVGLVSHWLATFVVAGQYFDRSEAQVVARTVGIAHVEDVLNPAISFSVPSLTYMWRFMRVWLLDPILKIFGGAHLIDIPPSFRSSMKERMSHPTVQRFLHYLQYSPPIQLILAAFVSAFCIYYLQTEIPPHGLELFAITMTSSARDDALYRGTDGGDASPAGAYVQLAPPSWGRVLFFMSCCGTLLSILLYGRISFPIPDLVAGTNVLKALRNEARGTTAKSNKTRVQKEQQDTMWSEVYYSIVGENRFRLACKVAVLRMLDASFCCVLLPRTVYLCRATGHCTSDPTLSELSKIFFPIGYAAPLREDGLYQSTFYSLNPDQGSAILLVASLIIITSVLLLAQLITLNKSYLAIMGHLSGEWKLVPNHDGQGASQWSSGRRYKKGDLIVYSFPGFRRSIYMATTNSPEGRPFDFFLRATHDLFQYELGHPSTSLIVATCAKIHCAFMGIIVVCIFFFFYMKYSIASLLTTLFANLIACYGLLRTGLMNYDEIEAITKEINCD